jgi:hypothetical protein
MYRGVTGQSPVPKKDFKKLLKILILTLILMLHSNRSPRFARDDGLLVGISLMENLG